MDNLYEKVYELKFGEKYVVTGLNEDGCREELEVFFIHKDFAHDIIDRYLEEQEGIRDAMFTEEEKNYYVFHDEESNTFAFIDNTTSEAYTEDENEDYGHINPAKIFANSDIGLLYKSKFANKDIEKKKSTLKSFIDFPKLKEELFSTGEVVLENYSEDYPTVELTVYDTIIRVVMIDNCGTAIADRDAKKFKRNINTIEDFEAELDEVVALTYEYNGESVD